MDSFRAFMIAGPRGFGRVFQLIEKGYMEMEWEQRWGIPIQPAKGYSVTMPLAI
jgi:hypothetical protein